MSNGMRQYHTLTRSTEWIQRLQNWSAQFKYVSILDNHSNSGYSYPTKPLFDLLIGVGKLDELKVSDNPFDDLYQFHQQKKDWLFGFLSYDLKNHVEELSSENEDGIRMPDILFFQPKYVFKIIGTKVEVGLPLNESVDQLIVNIESHQYQELESDYQLTIRSKIKHAEYIKSVLGLKHHIQVGDIYEVNFCQEFFAEKATISPWETYQKLADRSPTPFASYLRVDDKYLMCSSPERYIRKKGDQLLSQPIKGTIKRGRDAREDDELRYQLYYNTKERSENVMIVDLVRNDLSKSAVKGTVKVSELFGIYAFPQVHQMISSVESNVKPETRFTDVLKDTFPMGSMTGAPKVKAMELIEQFESTKRGLYSGAVGYISPEQDFDFNVVIRSIQYNSTDQYLNFMVGGAITDKADPEAEYQESLLKAKAIFEVLSNE